MPDEPTMWELKRTIESGYKELSADITQLNDRLSMYVLKEVYEAHRVADQQRYEAARSADRQRISVLEEQAKDQREQSRKAFLTAVTSFIAPIVVAVVLAFILRGG